LGNTRQIKGNEDTATTGAWTESLKNFQFQFIVLSKIIKIKTITQLCFVIVYETKTFLKCDEILNTSPNVNVRLIAHSTLKYFIFLLL
jgi:hypothetical protein